MSVDRSQAYGSLLPSAVMTDLPRRLSDAPRHQRNRQNGAIGTIAIAHKHSPPPSQRQLTPPSSSGVHRQRHQQRLTQDAINEHRGNGYMTPSNSITPIGTARARHPAHDKGWTEPPRRTRQTSVRNTKGGGENRAAAFHEELSPCRRTDAADRKG